MYVYAGIILETESSIQQSSSDNNCCFIAICYLNLTIKKELQEEVDKSQWSALKGFNWRHSKSYVMPQPTDLFCHTIFFVKFNICTSLETLREHILPYDFPVDQGHTVPHKVWRDLFLKAFYFKWGTVYWGGGTLYRGLMIRSYRQGWGSFINTFFSNHFSFFQSWRDKHSSR